MKRTLYLLIGITIGLFSSYFLVRHKLKFKNLHFNDLFSSDDDLGMC